MLRTLPDADRERLAGIIERNWPRLTRARGFVGARPGFRVTHGDLIREPAIVAVVRAKVGAEYLTGDEKLPDALDGVPVDVVVSDPHTELELRAEPEGLDSSPMEARALKYEGLPGDPIDASFDVARPLLCHVGPDSAWIVLRDFVEETRQNLTAAMYERYHVVGGGEVVGEWRPVRGW